MKTSAETEQSEGASAISATPGSRDCQNNGSAGQGIREDRRLWLVVHREYPIILCTGVIHCYLLIVTSVISGQLTLHKKSFADAPLFCSYYRASAY